MTPGTVVGGLVGACGTNHGPMTLKPAGRSPGPTPNPPDRPAGSFASTSSNGSRTNDPVDSLTIGVVADRFQTARQQPCLGLAALGGAMTYEKPDIRDFGNIADHTYDTGSCDADDFGCASGPGLIDVPVGRL